ncbi:phasin family protein [Acinetobacter terrae]|jgi:poly(hydroxyalkanoate) granule-associated protein|uniref:Poly(Hydroxyalcanoate) granule associated protein n=1 Tax=Acinetobacter terrae TaxID=2731247 RepID=A0A4R0EQQ7_9GAMM|nr:phasin family protein [Acinetobacter terrae]NNH15403.1 phasin family protein [Acinetobacter terrae]OAL81953.1 poly(hydroxyalcanoate) granule associated protein [Acinetobacter terrae]TCB61987.1 poly(hydroxyalcanoate) granule associated protein [Acinetobacter terrae]
MDKQIEDQDDEQKAAENTDKKKNKSRDGRKSGLDFRKYTQQIWLAGLGAFSRAEEEGNKLFDSLVKVGEELESKTTEIADQTVEKVSEKAKESVTDTKDKVEKLIDHSVNHSLNRIGLVTVKDIQHLESLILQLHSKVDFLLEENKSLKEQIVKK